MSVNDEASLQRTRNVYKQSNAALKDCEDKEERLMLLEAWKDFEVNMLAVTGNVMSMYCIDITNSCLSLLKWWIAPCRIRVEIIAPLHFLAGCHKR